MITKAANPKFNAGDMITGRVTMSDGSKQWQTYMVNRIIEDPTYGTMYSLDNGSGFIDARERTDSIDAEFNL
jgi:hypothetical protein